MEKSEKQHAVPCYSYPYGDGEIFCTQGGGTVTWDEGVGWWVFVDPPDGFETGDAMPSEWGIA